VRFGIGSSSSVGHINPQYRAKSDVKNPVMAGCLVGGWLGKGQGPLAIAGGCATFAAFSYAVELYMHRETEEED
jgi:mitochondrial import inner membrane translocase subunit TIM22